MSICAHFGFCGGCSKQNVPYEAQLAAKENVVRTCLAQQSIQKFHPILPSPDVYFYRNKMEFSFGDERDLKILGRPVEKAAAHLGLHPKGRFALVTPTPECLLLSEESQKICGVVGEWATINRVPVFVRKNAEGDLRHLVIREGKNTGERMVNLVSKSTTASVDLLAGRLKESGCAITTFIWTAYDGLSDVAGGDQRTAYWGDGVIREKFSNVTLTINPVSFMQTNTRAAEKMIDVLRAWIQDRHPGESRDPGLEHQETNWAPAFAGATNKSLIDLYCGSGAIGLCLADLFDQVIGVEINKSAVLDARENATRNGIENARFLDGKAEDLVKDLPIRENAADTTVIVDPPRAGLHPKLTQTLLEWSVPRLFYVSCNPETLARDLQVLSERYDILDAQPMDFFPHTDHIETAVRLCLKH